MSGKRHTKVWCNITQSSRLRNTDHISNSLYPEFKLRSTLTYRDKTTRPAAPMRSKLSSRSTFSNPTNTTGLEWDHAVGGNVIRRAAVVSAPSPRWMQKTTRRAERYAGCEENWGQLNLQSRRPRQNCKKTTNVTSVFLERKGSPHIHEFM